MGGEREGMKAKIIDIIALVFVILVIVWRVIMEQLDAAPQWMHPVMWVLLAMVAVCIVLHFILRHQEKKQKDK